MRNEQIEDRENLPPSLIPLDFESVFVLRQSGNKRVIRFADQSDDYGAQFLEVDLSYDPGDDSISLDIRQYNTNVYQENLSSSVRQRLYLRSDEWKILREQVDLFQTEQRLKALAEPERISAARAEADYPF